jgi:hypothetical protein
VGAFDDLLPTSAAPAPPRVPTAFDDLLPTGSDAAIRSVAQSGLKNRKKTYDFGESFMAGILNSVPALALSNPDYELANDPTVGGRLGYQAGQMLADLPVMVAGAVMGAGVGTAGAPGVGTAVGGAAGAFGLPAGLRATLMDAYDKGEFKDFGDFWNRASHIIWETVKGQAVGGATALAGAGVASKVGSETLMVANPAGKLVQSVAPTAAELATMTTVGAALEGRVPSAKEFLDAAVLLGGMKASTKVAAKLREVYKETGVRPAQVVADAARDPEIAKALVTDSGGLDQAQKNNTFKYVEGDTTKGYGNMIGYPQAAGTPIEKLFSNFADSKTSTPEQLSEFRSSMFGRANAKIENFKNDPVHTQIDALPNGLQVRVDAAESGGTRMQVIDGSEVVGAARVKNGMIDSIAVVESAKGKGIGVDMLRYMDENGIANIREVPDRSPGFVKAQKEVLSSPEKSISRSFSGDIPRAYAEAAAADRLASAVPDARVDPERALKIQSVIDKPMAEVPMTKEPNHINYSYVHEPADVKAIHSRVAEVFSSEIEQARGKESWNQTEAKARRMLEDAAKNGDEGAARLLVESGGDVLATPFRDLAAHQMATLAMAQKTAFDIRSAAEELQKAKGTAGEEAAAKKMADAIETSALIQAVDQGNAAEVARALNARKAMKQTANLVASIKEVQAKYGKDPEVIAKIILDLTDPNQLNKFGREAAKAKTLEKVIEAWKAGLLSGPWTHAANLLGNTTFIAMRPLVDAVAAGIGMVKGGPDAVSWREPFARLAGNAQAVKDAAHVVASAYGKDGFAGVLGVAKSAYDSGNLGAKGEQNRQANTGAVGKVVQVPFKMLSAADTFFKSMNERGEAYTLAIRQALSEELSPQTREFSERVAQLVENPTKEMQEKITDAGVRFTFNKELGEGGKSIQHLVQAVPILQFIMPFVRTPINIFKELQRLTPFAPALKEWRDAFNGSAAEQAKAMAEMSIGTALMGWGFSAALDGTITGMADPDPGKRRVQLASGWQPYSIKIKGSNGEPDKYYSYQRIQPLGTLLGLAADMATVHEHMTDDEVDKLPKILATAFANSVTNQTMLQGVTQIVQATTDPTRFAPRMAQGFAGSIVPAALSQTAQMSDPIQREVNSMLDAIKNRIPGVREGLMPKLDAFGQPVQTKDKAGFVFPIQISEASDDPVRKEAMRLAISVAAPPKKMHFGANTGKIGDVKLTPEQTQKFQEVSGNMAHDIMAQVIASGSWATMPDIAKRMTFQRAELVAHKAGALAALPPETRGPIIQQIADKLTLELQKVHAE